MSASLAAWLASEANVPANRLPALLDILRDNWIDDVSTLSKTMPTLEKHLPAAAKHTIMDALKRRTETPQLQMQTRGSSSRSADTESAPTTPKFSASGYNLYNLKPPGGRSTAMKLLEPIEISASCVAEESAEEANAYSPVVEFPSLKIQQQQQQQQQQQHKSEVALREQSNSSRRTIRTLPNPDFVRQTKAYRLKLRRMYRCTVMPTSTFMQRWDLLVVLVLFFIATVTPFEVGFLSMEYNALYFVNRAVDLTFVFDIVLNFFVAYREKTEVGGAWVFDNRKIAAHYLKGWFMLDVISAVPTDTIMLAMDGGASISGGGEGTPTVAARLLRLVRLVKLIRIVRISRIFARWQASIGLSYAVTTLVEFLLLVVIMAHWLACLWAFVGRNSGDGILSEDAARDPINQSWIEKAGLVGLFDEHSAEGPIPGAFRLYGAALYVSLNNIFGGSCEINPANYVEYYLHCVMSEHTGVEPMSCLPTSLPIASPLCCTPLMPRV